MKAAEENFGDTNTWLGMEFLGDWCLQTAQKHFVGAVWLRRVPSTLPAHPRIFLQPGIALDLAVLCSSPVALVLSGQTISRAQD